MSDLFAATPAMQTEAQFREYWLEHVAREIEPFRMAVRGGAAAAGFAGVFSAGYQAALRVTFPDVHFQGWAAFVVSENTAHDERPGLVCATDDGVVTLSGWKTWVAACDVVDELVVRATDAQGDYQFYLVPRSTSGLTIQRKDRPSVLPHLSQGAARFEDVRLESAPLDASRVRDFSLVEPFYIYLAFMSMAYQRFANEPLRENIRLVLADVANLDPVTATPQVLAGFDGAVQNLRRGLVNLTEDVAWKADAKLISMYSKAMQKRL